MDMGAAAAVMGAAAAVMAAAAVVMAVVVSFVFFLFHTKFPLKFESFLLGYSKGGYGGYRDASADDTDKAPHKWHFGEPLHLFGQEVKLTTAKKSFTRATDPSH